MKTIIIFFTIFIPISASSFPGWVQQNSGTTTEFKCIQFINELTGFAVGYSAIVKTTNGGNTWTTVNTSSDNRACLHMLNENTGFISRTNDLAKTTNGGATLTPIISGETPRQIYFVNATKGWYLTGNNLYLTTNAGETWDIISSTPSPTSSTSMSFIDEHTGWRTSYRFYQYPHYNEYLWSLDKTENGGQNFSWNAGGSLGSFFVTDPFVYFYNESLGFVWIPSNFGFKRTTNGGGSWVASTISGSIGFINDIRFINQDTGWMCGSGIANTTNKGENWNMQYSGQSLKTIFFINKSTGWAAGSNGTIVKTTTSGITGIEPGSQNNPVTFRLEQNYPNPFNPLTRINYELQNTNYVKMSVYDVNGKLVYILVNGKQNAGSYSVTFDGSTLASGVYYYRLEIHDVSTPLSVTEVKRMMLIK